MIEIIPFVGLKVGDELIHFSVVGKALLLIVLTIVSSHFIQVNGQFEKALSPDNIYLKG